ncbi:MAG: hypothetical protein EGQ45_04960, partial [Clostridiales bacterium]|nr:hypothetical protein [Clostridiales bacterium]
MKRTLSTNLFRLLCCAVIMLALAASMISVPVFAASNGIYIATATPHYRHPVTGVIEDAGGDGSAVLGQSMTESATYRRALVEVDSAGQTYITVRLQLMDNIENPVFQVDGAAVNATLMQEDYTNNTADYRMRVGSENSVIRCSMYVVAMGRQVVFYITVSNLQARTARKLENQRKELAATHDRERLRRLGDILTANLYAVKRGQTKLCAADFYDPEMKEIEIPL